MVTQITKQLYAKYLPIWADTANNQFISRILPLQRPPTLRNLQLYPSSMQKLTTSLLCLFFIIAVATSCKKDENKTSKSNTELIASGSWKFQNAKSGGMDVSGFVPACWKDNVVLFVE